MRKIAYHSQEIFGSLKNSIKEEYIAYKAKKKTILWFVYQKNKF